LSIKLKEHEVEVKALKDELATAQQSYQAEVKTKDE